METLETMASRFLILAKVNEPVAKLYSWGKKFVAPVINAVSEINWLPIESYSDLESLVDIYHYFLLRETDLAQVALVSVVNKLSFR